MSEPADRGPQFDAEAAPAVGTSNNDDLLEKFARWDDDLTAHWSKWVAEAKDWYEFIAGRQWSPEEEADMAVNGKIPVVFNLAGPVIDAVQGAEIQNRQQVQYYPRDVDDTGINDVLTQGADYVNDACNGDQEDSEAFWDCLVCGIGWTETRPEVDGEEVELIKERVDPLQMRADPASRKRCFDDARYVKREIPMSLDEFEDFKLEIGRTDLDDGELDGGGIGDGKRLTVVDPRQRYTNGTLGQNTGETVVVCEWQWWDRQPVHLAALPADPANPTVTKIAKLTQAQFDIAIKANPDLKHAKSTQKVFYRAFATTSEVLFKEVLAEGSFRYKAMTGKRDRNTGTWFGLVKAMVDPGKFVNKLYSEVLHIVRTNANGGMALETDAVDDVRDFENTWASSDKITWMKPGALSGPHGSKMVPKAPPPVQPVLFQLMEFARDMVKATTGVNEEILGLVQREQAGVLEAQRKQAAYGILSAFFDAKRRYQRGQGLLLLAQMRIFMPDDKLVRIVEKGIVQYVPLAKSIDAEKYDVIIDEAPAGPDFKAKVMAVLGPMLPELLAAQLIGPEEIADMMPYLDLPASVAMKLGNAIRGRAQQAAQAAQQPDPMKQAVLADKQASAGQKSADAELKKAKAFKDVTDAHASHLNTAVQFMRATNAAPQIPEQPGEAPAPDLGVRPAPPPATGILPGEPQ